MHMISFVFDIYKKKLFYIRPLKKMFSNYFKRFVYRVPLLLDDSCLKVSIQQ